MAIYRISSRFGERESVTDEHAHWWLDNLRNAASAQHANDEGWKEV